MSVGIKQTKPKKYGSIVLCLPSGVRRISHERSLEFGEAAPLARLVGFCRKQGLSDPASNVVYLNRDGNLGPASRYDAETINQYPVLIFNQRLEHINPGSA